MRKALLAATLIAFSTAPVLADEVDDAKALIAAAELNEETDLYMWCGAAFTVVSGLLGEAPEAAEMENLANILFAIAEPMLTEQGVADADLASFGAAYAMVAANQVVYEAEEAAYSREDCQLAAE